MATLSILVVLAAPATGQWPQEGRTPSRNATVQDAGPPADLITNTSRDAVLWSASPGHATGDSKEEIEAGPVLGEGVAVVATVEGTVAGYDALTGNRLWSYVVPASEHQDKIVGTPAIVDGNAIVGAQDGVVRALDLDDGTVQWTEDLSPSGDDADWPRTAVHARDGTVFVGTLDGYVVALDPGTGREQWRTRVTSLQEGLVAGFTSAETSSGTWLYAPTVTRDIAQLDPRDGTLSRESVGASIYGSAAVDEADRLFVGFGGGDDAGDAARFNASNLAPGWQTGTASGELRSDVLDHDGTLYLGGEGGTLHALDADDGSSRWRETLVDSPEHSPAIRGQPVLANGTLYVPTEDGILFAVNPGTGKEVWSLDLGAGCEETRLTCGLTSPVVWEGKLYAASEDGILWVLGPQSAAGPQPPSAEVSVLERGMTIDLDASPSSDPNDDELDYTWRLGDGATARGEHLAYTYRQPGNYSVRLIVEDGTGRSDTRILDIQARPAPSTPWTGPGGDPGADRASPDRGPSAWSEVWRRTFPTKLPSDPLVGRWGVLAASTDGTVRSYTLGGDHEWTRELDEAQAVARGNATVVVATGEKLQTLDPARGADSGNYSLAAPVETLAMDGALVAAGSDEGGIAVWNVSSGANWTVDLPTRIRDGPAFGPEGDRVAVLTVTNNLYVYQSVDGALVYGPKNVPLEARRMSVDDRGLVLSGQKATGNGGSVHSLNLDDGTPRWTYEQNTPITGHAAGEKVYATGDDDTVTALDRTANLTTGRRTWSESLDVTVRGTIAAADEALVVPTADGVRLLDPTNGTLEDTAGLAPGTRHAAVHETLAAVQRDAPAERTPALVVAGTVPYEANFTVTPPKPEVGETVTFQDTSLAPSGAGRTFAFGDGNTTSASRATHTYAETGNYTARLTVSATGGAPKLVTLRDVQIVPAPSPGDGDGNATEPPTNDTDGDGNATEPPADGDDGDDDEPPTDGGDEDRDGGTPYRPDAAVPGFEALAAAVAAALAATVRRRRRTGR